MIPQIVENPDRIEVGGKTRVGRETIRYVKRTNGETYFVEEVRTGKKQLIPATLYKRKAPAQPKLSTPEAALLSEQQRVSAETDAENDDTTLFKKRSAEAVDLLKIVLPEAHMLPPEGGGTAVRTSDSSSTVVKCEAAKYFCPK